MDLGADRPNVSWLVAAARSSLAASLAPALTVLACLIITTSTSAPSIA